MVFCIGGLIITNKPSQYLRHSDPESSSGQAGPGPSRNPVTFEVLKDRYFYCMPIKFAVLYLKSIG
jgi:hypothetical protein